mgnify:FL=1
MKILRSIDKYLDSFEKRIFLFILFITFYWLWQNIWQLLLFFKLIFITDYESLFNLQAKLSAYESSVFIRIIYCVISNPSLTIHSILSCITAIDILGLFGFMCLIKRYKKIAFLMLFKYVWCLFWLMKGLNSMSVYLVINCLKWLSLGAFLSVAIVLLLWLHHIVGDILEYGRNVHEL